MYARIATFEGATGIDEVAQSIRESDRPEGLPATAVYLMADREAGKVVTVTFFATEEDLRLGNETLNTMAPPGGGLGRRVSVDLMEVVAQLSE